MRPVYVREMKELSPVLALVAAAAVVTGIVFTGPIVREFDEMLGLPIAGGLALGVAQGMLDRWRRGDLFALHRPVAAARMEIARTLAGVTVALLGVAVLAVAHRISTAAELRDFAWWMRMRIGGTEPPDHLGADEIALLAAILLAGWAVTRLAAGALRARWMLPALVALPIAGWSLLARASSFPSATAFALALALVFSFGSVLCLAGDRR